jgi:hypothetical protein
MGYEGESLAVTTGYRDTSDGGQEGGGFHVYEYTFVLDPTKEVRSLTLPTNANVEIFAASLAPADTTSTPPPTSPSPTLPPPTLPMPPVPPRLALRQKIQDRLAEIRQQRQARLQEIRLRRQVRLQEILARRQVHAREIQAHPAQVRPRLQTRLVFPQVQGKPSFPDAALAFVFLNRRQR